ncbi:MAG: hypothetical protein ACYDA8_15145 [Deferrisomatales bacterium]
MMQNELRNGYGAYELSLCNAGRSGYSFGPVQWDLASRNQVVEDLFRDILTNARYPTPAGEPAGALIFGDTEIEPVMKAVTTGAVLTEGQIIQVNAALSSAYGMAAIHTAYPAALAALTQRVDGWIAGVTDTENRAFLATDFARLFLVDYDNQFPPYPAYIPLFLKGEAVTIGKWAGDPDGTEMRIQGDLGIADLVSYRLHTQYGQEKPGDTVRRISNVLEIVGAAHLAVSAEDAAFLTLELPKLLGEAAFKAARERLDNEGWRALLAAAERVAGVAPEGGSATPPPEVPLAFEAIWDLMAELEQTGHPAVAYYLLNDPLAQHLLLQYNANPLLGGISGIDTGGVSKPDGKLLTYLKENAVLLAGPDGAQARVEIEGSFDLVDYLRFYFSTRAARDPGTAGQMLRSFVDVLGFDPAHPYAANRDPEVVGFLNALVGLDERGLPGQILVEELHRLLVASTPAYVTVGVDGSVTIETTQDPAAFFPSWTDDFTHETVVRFYAAGGTPTYVYEIGADTDADPALVDVRVTVTDLLRPAAQQEVGATTVEDTAGVTVETSVSSGTDWLDPWTERYLTVHGIHRFQVTNTVWDRTVTASFPVSGDIEELFEQGQARTLVSPIVLDLDGDGYETTTLVNGTRFDFDLNGFAEQMAWVNPDDGLLVLDRNGDGLIQHGGELFGDRTVLLDGSPAEHGFQALAELDLNEDGKVDEADPFFEHLRVWQDLDHDGVSDPGELRRLADLGIGALATDSTSVREGDGRGNVIIEKGTFVWADGRTGPMGAGCGFTVAGTLRLQRSFKRGGGSGLSVGGREW